MFSVRYTHRSPKYGSISSLDHWRFFLRILGRTRVKRMTQRLLTAAIGFLTLAGLALAQAPAPTDQPAAAAPAVAPAGGGELQQIVVTGYIIPRLGEGTQPVFSIDRDFWERRGEQNVAQI